MNTNRQPPNVIFLSKKNSRKRFERILEQYGPVYALLTFKEELKKEVWKSNYVLFVENV